MAIPIVGLVVVVVTTFATAFVPMAGRGEEGMHFAVDQALSGDLPGCIDPRGRLQHPWRAFWNQVVQIDHHAVLPKKGMRVEIGIEHEADNFTAVIDRFAAWISLPVLGHYTLAKQEDEFFNTNGYTNVSAIGGQWHRNWAHGPDANIRPAS
jgi:hypothetical protein